MWMRLIIPVPLLIALALAAVLGGCGGGDSPGQPPATTGIPSQPPAVDRSPASATAPGGTPSTQPRDDGPWNRDVLLSRSKDGVAFGTPVTLVERAGVPCVIQERSGRLAAVFQWFPFSDRAAFDRVAIVFSTDSGRSWSAPQTVTVTGMPADLMRPFDPAIVQLEDGRYRLYFTSNARSGPGVPAIYSAISDDAVQFRFEAGARFAPAQGTVDASVVFFAGAWHLFSHNQRANTGLGYHAVSDDGLSFRQLADVNIGAGKQWIGNATVAGGLLRYYGSGVDGVWSATSSDGAAWTLEQGVRVAGGDASAVFLPGGEVVLLAVGPLRADAGPAPF